MPLLSIVIPIFNEESTIVSLLNKVLNVNVSALDVTMEIVVVDDCSTDGTWTKLERVATQQQVRIFRHAKNRGKGAALRTAFEHVRGDIIIVQDADHEYDPGEYPLLLKPILDGQADVVYGSRYLPRSPMPVHRYWHTIANKFFTLVSNFATNVDLTDAQTCYKVFRREILTNMHLRENRFGFDPEFTAKMARELRRTGGTICEVAISYRGRSYHEGKKISWIDAFAAMYCIIRYNVFL